jgi:hypothetical protein
MDKPTNASLKSSRKYVESTGIVGRSMVKKIIMARKKLNPILKVVGTFLYENNGTVTKNAIKRTKTNANAGTTV